MTSVMFLFFHRREWEYEKVHQNPIFRACRFMVLTLASPAAAAVSGALPEGSGLTPFNRSAGEQSRPFPAKQAGAFRGAKPGDPDRGLLRGSGGALFAASAGVMSGGAASFWMDLIDEDYDGPELNMIHTSSKAPKTSRGLRIRSTAAKTFLAKLSKLTTRMLHLLT
jgi:hypothetical protein